MTDRIEKAAHEIDAIPTDRREAIWTLLWQGAGIGTMVLVMEYVVFSPIWNHIVLPLWERIA